MTAAIPGLRPTTEQISGAIERVTFHNEDSGFCVLRVKTKGAPVVLIGQKKTLGIAVRNDRPQRRYSGLLASLRGGGTQTITSTALGGTRKRTPSHRSSRTHK
jgi:hypothetical protein